MGAAYKTDPILKLIDPEDAPNSFLLMQDDEQMARGRYYLMTRALSGNTLHAWITATTTPLDTIRAALADITDEMILDGLERAKADFAE